MKKWAVILFVGFAGAILLTLAGCSETGLKLQPAAEEYLRTMSVSDSRIISCDFERVQQYQPAIKGVTMRDAAEDIKTLFPMNYTFTEQSAREIRENDLVELHWEDSSAAETPLPVVACAGKSAPVSLQKQLLGMKENDSGVWNANEGDALLLGGEKGSQIRFTVQKIFSCDVRNSNVAEMLASNMIFSPSDCYNHLIRVHTDDLALQNKYLGRLDFLEHARKSCQYRLSEKDLEAASQIELQALRDNAAMLQMSLEDYWASFSESFSVETDTDPYQSAVMFARRKIEEALCIGAMAAEKELSVSEKDAVAFYELENFRMDDSDKAKVNYAFLEDRVITACDPELEGSRMIPVRATLTGTFEKETQESGTAENEPGSMTPDDPAVIQIVNKIHTDFYRINLAARTGTASEEEITLNSYKPNIFLDSISQKIIVRLSVNEEDLEKASALFRKLVGDYDCVEFEWYTWHPGDAVDY